MRIFFKNCQSCALKKFEFCTRSLEMVNRGMKKKRTELQSNLAIFSECKMRSFLPKFAKRSGSKHRLIKLFEKRNVYDEND